MKLIILLLLAPFLGALAQTPTPNTEAELKAEIKLLDEASQANYKAAEEWRAEAMRLAAENAQLKAQLAAMQEAAIARIQAARKDAFAAAQPAPQPRPRAYQPPAPSSTTTISGSGGIYTTHGSAGGATIIQTAPGHYEIRHRDGKVERLIMGN